MMNYFSLFGNFGTPDQEIYDDICAHLWLTFAKVSETTSCHVWALSYCWFSFTFFFIYTWLINLLYPAAWALNKWWIKTLIKVILPECLPKRIFLRNQMIQQRCGCKWSTTKGSLINVSFGHFNADTFQCRVDQSIEDYLCLKLWLEGLLSTTVLNKRFQLYFVCDNWH